MAFTASPASRERKTTDLELSDQLLQTLVLRNVEDARRVAQVFFLREALQKIDQLRLQRRNGSCDLFYFSLFVFHLLDDLAAVSTSYL